MKKTKRGIIKTIRYEHWRNENPGEGGVSTIAVLETGDRVFLGGSGHVLRGVAGGWESVPYSDASPASVGDGVIMWDDFHGFPKHRLVPLRWSAKPGRKLRKAERAFRKAH